MTSSRSECESETSLALEKEQENKKENNSDRKNYKIIFKNNEGKTILTIHKTKRS